MLLQYMAWVYCSSLEIIANDTGVKSLYLAFHVTDN